MQLDSRHGGILRSVRACDKGCWSPADRALVSGGEEHAQSAEQGRGSQHETEHGRGEPGGLRVVSSPSLEGREAEASALERELEAAGARATRPSDDELARYLEARGRLVRLGDGYVIGADAFEVAQDVLLTECRAAGGITLARFRDLVGVGRRDAQLLLERLDADGLTRRIGDRRVLRKAATSRPSS